MILTDLIREQILQVTVMFGAGIGVALCYQLMQLFCRAVRPGKAVRFLTEVLFWILAAVWTIQFLYYCAYGRLSFHAACGFGAGALLWKICFYDIIDKIYSNVKNKAGNEETTCRKREEAVSLRTAARSSISRKLERNDRKNVRNSSRGLQNRRKQRKRNP